MNLSVTYHEDGRHLPPENRADYLREQGWTSLEILRLYQAEDRRQQYKNVSITDGLIRGGFRPPFFEEG